MPKLTPMSTVADALKNPKAVALAESIKPGITRHPAIMMFRRTTLQQLCRMSHGRVSQQQLDEILKSINED